MQVKNFKVFKLLVVIEIIDFKESVQTFEYILVLIVIHIFVKTSKMVYYLQKYRRIYANMSKKKKKTFKNKEEQKIRIDPETIDPKKIDPSIYLPKELTL